MEAPREQTRALDYLRRKGTEASASVVCASLERALAHLEARLADIDDAAARRPPAAGGWSVLEVVDHLVESHRPAVEQLRRARRGEDPGPAIPAHLASDDPGARPWDDHRRALGEVHRGLLAAAREELDDPGRPIPLVMVVKARSADGEVQTLEWIEPLEWRAYAVALKVHSLEHLAQVDRILAAPG